MLIQFCCGIQSKKQNPRNYDLFDLGELDESTPPGIKRFKEGKGGNKVINAGEFLKFI